MELLNIFKDQIFILGHGLIRAIVIFFLTIGVIYIPGKMLGILHHWRIKNFLALIVICVASWFSIGIYDQGLLSNPLEKYWRFSVYTALSIVLYTTWGFDFFDRMNAWQDKIFGKVKDPNVNKMDQKTTAKRKKNGRK